MSDEPGEGVTTRFLPPVNGWVSALFSYETIQFRVLAENDVGSSFYRKHGYDVIDEWDTELFGETVLEYKFQGEID